MDSSISHMLETSARLLKLLSLLQVRRDWTGPELAGRLSVDVRTIRRDVDKLRSLGYPVTSLPGATGGYQLGAGAELPPLLLDDDEAVAVAIGLRTAANGTISGIEETSMRALTKLEQVLPTRLRRRVQALQAHTATPLTAAGPTVDAETLTIIAAACRDHQQLRFTYASTQGEPTKRLVEPQGLVHTGRVVPRGVGRVQRGLADVPRRPHHRRAHARRHASRSANHLRSRWAEYVSRQVASSRSTPSRRC